MSQNLDPWINVAEKIDQSKILRFPYKKYLKVSLTHYIMNKRLSGFSEETILEMLFKEEGMIQLLNDFKDYKDKIEENVWTCICARSSELKSLENMRK